LVSKGSIQVSDGYLPPNADQGPGYVEYIGVVGFEARFYQEIGAGKRPEYRHYRLQPRPQEPVDQIKSLALMDGILELHWESADERSK
jgi:hypothetical protein